MGGGMESFGESVDTPRLSRWNQGRPAVRAGLVALLLGSAASAAGLLIGMGGERAAGGSALADVASEQWSIPASGGVAAADASACGSFRVVDWAVSVAQDDFVGPAVPDSRPPADLIGLANALANSLAPQVSGPLSAAIRSYVYSVANLGAAINHADPDEATSGFNQLAELAAATVSELCGQGDDRPVWPATGGPGRAQTDSEASAAVSGLPHSLDVAPHDRKALG